MLKDSTIICISTIDWGFLWQRHQIFMRRFSESNNRVFYLENINPNPEINMSLISKALKRIIRILSGPKIKEKKPPENLTVITPFIIPFKNRISCFLNENIFFKILSLYLRLKGVNNPIVWTYVSTSSALKLIKDLDPSLLVYDCVFDVSLNPGSPKDIVISEKKLISAADLIFTDNRYLFKKCKDLNADTHLVPPGVDFENFQRHKAGSDTGLLDDIKKPRICFFGGIDKMHLDLELIAFIAKKRPDWSIVLLGPVIKTDVSPLKLKNIFLKGPVEHSLLTGYLAGMDALILPYKIIPFSKSIFPAKIFECLATGKPVVSTPLEELSFLSNGPIKTASSKEDFLKNIEEALVSDTEGAKKERLKIALDNSWSVRLETLDNALGEAMAKKTKNGLLTKG